MPGSKKATSPPKKRSAGEPPATPKKPAKRAKAPAKRARGRPTVYKPEYCKQVVDLGEQGLFWVQVARRLGVRRQTLHNWCDEHPEFLDAREGHKEALESFLINAGYDGMLGRLEKFNAATFKLFMANGCGWREKTEISGDPDRPIQVLKLEDLEPSGIGVKKG